MTSDTNLRLEAPAFQPVEPEPGPSFEPATAGPASTGQGPATEPVDARPPGPSRRTRTVVSGVLAAALLVLVGGLAFAAGRATAPATATGIDDAGSGVFDGGFGPGGPNGQLPGGGPGAVGDDELDGRFGPGLGSTTIRGTIRALDADSMTIELADGSAIEIAIDAATDYHRQAEASVRDVTTGSTVIVGIDGLALRDGTGATAGDVTIVP